VLELNDGFSKIRGKILRRMEMSDKVEIPTSHANNACSCLRAALRSTAQSAHPFIFTSLNGACADAEGGVDRAENKAAECYVAPTGNQYTTRAAALTTQTSPTAGRQSAAHSRNAGAD
jgi:hypothetical protein